jgi:hypothetical protein
VNVLFRIYPFVKYDIHLFGSTAFVSMILFCCFLLFVVICKLILLLYLSFFQMGGARRYPYPKWVWSPAGGWWPTSPNYKRNAVIYVTCSFIIMYALGSIGESKMVSIIVYICSFMLLDLLFLHCFLHVLFVRKLTKENML